MVNKGLVAMSPTHGQNQPPLEQQIGAISYYKLDKNYLDNMAGTEASTLSAKGSKKKKQRKT